MYIDFVIQIPRGSALPKGLKVVVPALSATTGESWRRKCEQEIVEVIPESGSEKPFYVFNKNGLRTKIARGPHKLLINPYDAERHIWIVDDDLHVINVFTNDGSRLVRTLGERGVPGRGPNNFNRPTDIAWLPDGTFFVSDGYAGTRVAKYDSDFNFLMDWGQPPVDPDNPGPYEFWSVHSIGISRDRRIFVADREHSRMQVFDENGNFLDMWPTGYESAVLTHVVTEDDYVWVADWNTDTLIKFDLEGRYQLSMGGPGPEPGRFDGVHQIHVDEEGNLYVTEVSNDRSQMFRPRPGADPETLIHRRVGDGPVRFP